MPSSPYARALKDLVVPVQLRSPERSQASTFRPLPNPVAVERLELKARQLLPRSFPLLQQSTLEASAQKCKRLSEGAAPPWAADCTNVGHHCRRSIATPPSRNDLRIPPLKNKVLKHGICPLEHALIATCNGWPLRASRALPQPLPWDPSRMPAAFHLHGTRGWSKKANPEAA